MTALFAHLQRTYVFHHSSNFERGILVTPIPFAFIDLTGTPDLNMHLLKLCKVWLKDKLFSTKYLNIQPFLVVGVSQYIGYVLLWEKT